MTSKFFRLFNLCTFKEKINFFLLALFMFINGLLEVLSIGMLIPLISHLISHNPNIIKMCDQTITIKK